PSLKMTTRCHSVFSLRSPVARSRQVSEVATLRLAIGRPSWVRRISGSLPRLPTRMTLFTLPAIAALHSITGRPVDRPSGSVFANHNPYRRQTLYARRRRRRSHSGPSRNYPHIAPAVPLFQLCSLQPAVFTGIPRPKSDATGMEPEFHPEFPKMPN